MQTTLKKGQIHQHLLESQLLRDNAAGEDHVRPNIVYTPPGYDSKRRKPYNLIIVLAPWTSAGRIQFEWKPFKESLSDRLDRLITTEQMGEAVVVAPDIYTRYGGTQFIDSEFFGPHGKHIVEEVLPFIRDHYNVTSDPETTGVFGRSSGGFGALRLALDYPGHFGRVASHSGDLGFETMFLGDLQTFPRLLGRYKDRVDDYIEDLFKKPKIEGYQVHALMLIGSCGFYSPNKANPLGYDFPIDLFTGEIDWEVWKRWKSNDPLEMIKQSTKSLEELPFLYVECGVKDQYHLLYGARQFHSILSDAKIKHRYEEFDDNHSGTDYRYDVTLPLLSPK